MSKIILGIPVVEREYILLDEQAFAQTTGSFAAEDGQCEVKFENEQLTLTGPLTITLRATSPTTFAAQEDEDVVVRFDGLEDGKFGAITIIFPFFTWTGKRIAAS